MVLNGYGSRQIAAIAIQMALTKTREEETEQKALFAKQGIKTASCLQLLKKLEEKGSITLPAKQEVYTVSVPARLLKASLHPFKTSNFILTICLELNARKKTAM
jgi:hypothetical protein